MPFEHVKEINEEKYNELVEIFPHLQSFNIFMMAKNLGVTFRPEDLDMEQLVIYSTIQTEMSKLAGGENATR